MELKLPNESYCLDETEMMYLDGGWRNWIVAGVGGAVAAFAAAALGEWGKQFARRYSLAWIGNKVLAFGGWMKACVLGAVNWAWANPWAALGVATGVAVSAAYVFKRMGY